MYTYDLRNKCKMALSQNTYSGAHISWHKLFLVGNQDNYKNIVSIMLTYYINVD